MWLNERDSRGLSGSGPGLMSSFFAAGLGGLICLLNYVYVYPARKALLGIGNTRAYSFTPCPPHSE